MAVAAPSKSAGGVYVTLLFALTVIVPSDALADVTLNSSLSTSVSLSNTASVVLESSVTLPASSLATGASLTGATVTVTVDEALPPAPSDTL